MWLLDVDLRVSLKLRLTTPTPYRLLRAFDTVSARRSGAPRGYRTRLAWVGLEIRSVGA